MPRTTTRTTQVTEPDAVDDVLAADANRTADQLGEALDTLSEFASEGTSFKVFKLPSFQYCKELDPPLDTTAMLEEVREEFGPGNYCIRVYMTGRKGCAAQRNFSIAPLRKAAVPIAAPPAGDQLTLRDLLPLLLDRERPAGLDMGALMAAQSASADRQMTMMTTMMTTIVAAISGGKESPTAMLSAMAPFINRPTSGAEEFATTFGLVRGLLPAPAGGEDDSIAALAVKALAPSVPDFAKGFADMAAGMRGRGAPAEAATVLTDPVDYTRAAPPAAHLAANTRFPVLAALREDVLFYFQRRMDPEIAADGLWTVLTSERFTAAGYSEASLAPVVTHLNASGAGWLDELAREGIDLRADPAWAHALFQQLVTIYRGDLDAAGGEAGGDGDAEGDGGAGQVGIAADADPQPRDPPDARAAV